MRQIVVAAMFGLAFIAPAHAAERDDAFAGAAESFMRGLVEERDVGLMFDYLREALDAAAEGREPPAAERLAQRAGEIGVEAKRRGVIAGHAVLDAIEQAARGIFGGSQRLSRPSPMQRSY